MISGRRVRRISDRPGCRQSRLNPSNTKTAGYPRLSLILRTLEQIPKTFHLDSEGDPAIAQLVSFRSGYGCFGKCDDGSLFKDPKRTAYRSRLLAN
jgi:hypothetical protein